MGVGRFASGLQRLRNPRIVADRAAAAQARTTRIGGAATQFLNPTLSGSQNLALGGVGAIAGIQGLFGGAVQNSLNRTRTQFLAGNRLAGLQGLLDEFSAPLGRGRSAADIADPARVGPVLAQLTALRDQFAFGGQAGREGVLDLDPGSVGGFLGRRTRLTAALPAPGLLGARQVALSQPGTVQNELARRLAESQGAVDTGGFIRNRAGLSNVLSRAALQGLDAPASAFARDVAGRQPQIVQDTLGPGPGDVFQDVVQGQIIAQNLTPKFGIRANLFPQGLQGLAEAGLLPFGVGGSTLPAQFAKNRAGFQGAAEDLFSPLLFGAG